MANSRDMDTVSSILNNLKVKGQDNEFVIFPNGSIHLNGKSYKQDEIEIIKTYHFEGESDSADEAIIYLIEANDGMIGYNHDAYGVYTNHVNDAFAEVNRNSKFVNTLIALG